MTAYPDLLGWLDDPVAERGIRFADRGQGWDFWSYQRLAELSRQVAGGLTAAGMRSDDVVALVQPSGPGFVASLFGILLAGGTPTPVAPPMTFQDPAAYDEHLAALLGAARPAVVICDPRLRARVEPIARRAGVTRIVDVDELTAGVDAATVTARPPARISLLQFTSGSSGTAAGVRVHRSALAANLAAITEWLGITPDDPTASWLPVHHDMGLIGCLLTPMVNTTDIWLLAPDDFVRNPVRYLRCFGVEGARLTAMPSFGLAYIARRVRPEQLAGCDFRQWRTIIVGAERVDADALRQVHELLGPYGLDRAAFMPAYGLAEATLAVTGVPLPEVWTDVTVDAASVAPGRQIAPSTDADALRLVGCGRPRLGVAVSIVDEDDREVPDDHVGEIVVRGDSVAEGYLRHHQPARVSRLDGGVLHSGDAGFTHDGQLYVLGRLGDSIKVRGRTVFAEDLEARLAELGVPARRLVVVLGERAGTPTVMVVFEQPDPAWPDRAVELLRVRVEGAEVETVAVPRGTIAWTSSGKPKRRQLWQAGLDGRLPAPITSGTR